MLRNIIGPGFDSRNGVFFCLFFCSFFFKISFSLQKEEDFWKTKKEKKKKLGPGFDSKKGKSWTRFWLYSISEVGVSEDRGAKRCQAKMPKILFWAFPICLKLLIWNISSFDFCWKWRAFFRGLMTFRDLGWASQKTRKTIFRGGAFMGAWLSGQNGQDTSLRNFALICFEEGNFSNTCVYVQKAQYFPICGQTWQNYHWHPFRVVGPNLQETMFVFGGGMLGSWSCFFFCGLNPSYFFVVGLLLFFENKTFLFSPKKGYFGLFVSVSLSSSLACLSLSLSLSLLLFFLPSLFSFFVVVSFFGACLCCLVSLPLFHNMNNFKILN